MNENLRQELVDIKDKLTEIIPKLEWELETSSIDELNESKIIIGSKIHELDVV